MSKDAKNNAPNLRTQPANVNSCGIWCPNCGAHLLGPAAPVLSEDTQLFEELWDWFNAPNGWGDGTGVWEKVEQRLAQPAAPKEQP